jgi:hypothetical protein
MSLSHPSEWTVGNLFDSSRWGISTEISEMLQSAPRIHNSELGLSDIQSHDLPVRKRESSSRNSWDRFSTPPDVMQGQARSLEVVQSSRTIDGIPPRRHQGKHKVYLYSKPHGRWASCIRGDAPWMGKTTNETRRPRKKILAQ